MKLFRENCAAPANGEEGVPRWQLTDTLCPVCLHTQRNTHPATCTELECDNCEYMIPLPEIYEIEEAADAEEDAEAGSPGDEEIRAVMRADSEAVEFAISSLQRLDEALDEVWKYLESRDSRLARVELFVVSDIATSTRNSLIARRG